MKKRSRSLSRGRYGTHRGYHTDLAARYRQQLTAVGREPAPAEKDKDAAGEPKDVRAIPEEKPVSAVLDPGSLAPAWCGSAPVLCLAGRGPLDEAALREILRSIIATNRAGGWRSIRKRASLGG